MTTPPPYPAETRAKGWRFEIDFDVVEQSETWPLAAEIPMCQHALLMMWLVAWSKQVPCGSMPADENSIRATCRIPPATWEKCRKVLMRGWWLASDGRLYHPTLTKRVGEMLAKRRSDTDRQIARRMKEAVESRLSPAGVTRDTDVIPAGLRRDSSTDHGTDTTYQKQENKTSRGRAPALSKPDDVDDGIWRDWCALRKAKRAPVSETAVDMARTEAGKAGLTLEAFLRVWCGRGSQGLEAAWLKPNGSGGGQQLTYRERDVELAAARVAEITGGRVNAKPSVRRIFDDSNTIDEVQDAAKRLG